MNASSPDDLLPEGEVVMVTGVDIIYTAHVDPNH